MTKSEIRKLKELRQTLSMQNAGFRDRLVEPETKFGRTEKETVEEVTRVWRESWVFPILDDLIEKYEKSEGKIS